MPVTCAWEIDVGLTGIGEGAAANILGGEASPGMHYQPPTLVVGETSG